MRSVIQRVNRASVEVDGKIIGEIGKGILVLLGVCDEDTDADIKWLADKIIGLRIFTGELLVVSQFTLFGDCKKGRRPSFASAGKPDYANDMYEKFVAYCRENVKKVATGEFGADMKVSLENDGPVTLIIDSKA